MIIEVLILILGFALLITGANFLINGSSSIAKKLHVSEILIGLTIVSLGTTLPELMVTIISSASNSTDIIVGNVIGSNLCNLLFILGIIAIIKPIKFEKATLKFNLPLLILINILVLIMGVGIFSNSKFTFTRIHGIILLIVALIYFLVPIISYLRAKQSKQDKEYKENKEKHGKISSTQRDVLKSIISIILGAIALKFGGDFVVDSATYIAERLNISQRVIGLTVVAIGTSLPELITSIVAIIKNNEDLAEGNLIGACTINFCLNLGLGATLCDLAITPSYIENLVLLLICAILILLFGIVNKKHMLTRLNGTILFVVYLIYSIKLFI